jgi:hypothetical protein
MNADECNRHASDCAERAALAEVEWVAQDFLKLAAQWRALAIREGFLGLPSERVVKERL